MTQTTKRTSKNKKRPAATAAKGTCAAMVACLAACSSTSSVVELPGLDEPTAASAASATATATAFTSTAPTALPKVATAAPTASAAATDKPDEALVKIRAEWASQAPIGSAPSLPKGSLAVLNDVCNMVVKGKEVGCACCPPNLGPDCYHSPSDPDIEPRFVPTRAFWGAFTGAKKRGVFLVDSGGCGYNLGSYGAQIVAEQGDRGWRLVHQSPGTTVEQAVPWRLDDGSQGLVTLSRAGKTPWFVLAFERFTPGAKVQRLVEWSNSGHTWCGVLAEGLEVASAKLLGSAKQDRNGDGKADLVVRLSVRTGKVTKAHLKECSDVEAAQAHLPFEKRTSFIVADRLASFRSELVFFFDGTKFTAKELPLKAFQRVMGGG